MNDPTEQLIAQIQIALVQGAASAFAPLQDDLQALVGKPVERQGGRVIRSKPGEPPRKDTGALQSRVIATAIDDGNRIRVSLAVDVPYAEPLAKSGRVFITNELAQRLPEIADQLADRITASNS